MIIKKYRKLPRIIVFFLQIIFDFSPFIAFFLSIHFKINTGIFFFAILSLIWIYLLFVKFNQFEVKEIEINTGKLNDPFEFVFVSDLHIGKKFYATGYKRIKKLVEIINSLKVETLVLGGDIFDHNVEPKIALPLLKFKQKNKIAILGNHDSDYIDKKRHKDLPQEVINYLRGIGFKVLINESINIDKISFVGITDLYSRMENFDRAFKNVLSKNYKILLSHNPDVVNFKGLNSDLIISGHNHAGQIYLPFIGTIFPIPSQNKDLLKGLYKKNNYQILVSEGAGHSITRLRIGTFSEILKIKLT